VKRHTHFYPFINLPVADEILISRELSPYQFGLLRKMTLEMWFNNDFGLFPDDDKQIAKICGTRTQLVTEARRKIDKHLTKSEGGLSDNAWIHHYTYVANKTQTLKKSGRKGGLKSAEVRQQLLKGGSSISDTESNSETETISRGANIVSSNKEVQFESTLWNNNIATVKERILPFIQCNEKCSLKKSAVELCTIEREGVVVPSPDELIKKYNLYVDSVKETNGGETTFAKGFHTWLEDRGFTQGVSTVAVAKLSYRNEW